MKAMSIYRLKIGKHRLEIIAEKAEGGKLVSPISGNMTGKVNESIQATVKVAFYRGADLLVIQCNWPKCGFGSCRAGRRTFDGKMAALIEFCFVK